MSEIKYCLVCLTTDVKFSIKDFSNIYTTLTQIKVNNLNQHLCYECAGYLMKYKKFRSKCIHADKILSQTIVKPKLTKYHLQTLQNKFNLASNLEISNVVTEDVTNSALSEFNEISNLTDIDESDDNGILIFLQNDERIPPLDLKPELEVFTHNDDYADKNTMTSNNKSHNIGRLSKQDNENVNCKQSAKGITSSNTYSPRGKNKNKKKQIIVPESKTIMLSSDDESYHSDSSWTTILNTLNRIRSANKELTLNNKEETGTANSMPEVENVHLSDNSNICKTNNTEEIMVESTTELNSQTRLKIKSKPTETKTQCVMQKKLSRHDKTLKTLKKYGIIEILNHKTAKNEMLTVTKSQKLPFKCDICFKGFGIKDALENHMHKHSPERGEYECDYCHWRFRNKNLMRGHMVHYHIYKFKCRYDGCSFECNMLLRGITHVKFHEGKQYNCEFCKLTFRAPHSKFAHMYKDHKNKFENEFICELCGRIFYSASGLRSHKLLSHFNEKNGDHQGPECKECKVHFATEQAWELHLVLSRKHEVPHGCKICGKRFDCDNDLKLHSKFHYPRSKKYLMKSRNLPEKPEPVFYECQICQSVYKSEYTYQRHLHFAHEQPKPTIVSAIPKKHICEICGEKFPAQSLLKYHQYIHTGERPFKCQYCGQGFRYAGLQRAHENTHTRACVYKCHVCNKEFLRYTTREKHVRQCMGHTFHKCVECGQSFINKSTLKSHVRHKHEKVPYPPRKNPRYKKQKRSKPVAEENI